jgi:uncharacterized protein
VATGPRAALSRPGGGFHETAGTDAEYPPRMDDRAVVARQLGRPPRALGRVAVRCPFGRPAVTEQQPYDRSGRPFPTTYYLTCPHLVAAVSRLEAAGGVERWTEAADRDRELAASLAAATEEQRALRRELAGGRRGDDGGASLDLGIGGSGRSGSLKCLHAHVAFALARPGYLLGERILAEVDSPWPTGECCTAEQAVDATRSPVRGARPGPLGRGS